MLGSLEQIVRPASTADFRPSIVANKYRPAGPDNPNSITWGKAGDDIFTITASEKAGFKWDDKDKDKKEITRKYDVVRVKNKDDPEQYVDTEVVTEYQVQSGLNFNSDVRNKISKDRYTLRFAKPKATENTEIISRDNVRTTAL